MNLRFVLNKKRITSLLVVFCVFYFLIVLMNLHLVPVAWLDETMNLDPAVQWKYTGNYVSAIWPNVGSENLFLCYLPGIAVIHRLTLEFFGPDIYFVRLPFILFFAVACFLYWKIAINYLKAAPWLAALFLFFLMTDKSVFESLRSVRSEMLELLLMLVSFWFIYNKRYMLSALSCSFLSLTHPKMWAVCLVIAIFSLLLSKGLGRKIAVFVILCLPWIFFLVSFNWQINTFINQLLKQASLHDTSEASFLVKAHFVDRFYPYNSWNLLPMLLNAFAFTVFVFRIFKHRAKGLSFVEWCFAATSIFWMFALAPHNRYNPALLVMASMVLLQHIKVREMVLIQLKYLVLILVGLFVTAIPAAGRMALGMVQINERNPYACIDWMEKNIAKGEKKSLLIGEAIAYYFYANHQASFDYMIHIYPHKFDFDKYDKVYYITSQKIHLPALAKYNVANAFNVTKFDQAKTVTYQNLFIYEISSRNQFDSLFARYRINY